MSRKIWPFLILFGVLAPSVWIMSGPLYGFDPSSAEVSGTKPTEQGAEPRPVASEKKPRTAGYPETLLTDRPILREGGWDRPLLGIDRSKLAVWIARQAREGQVFQAILQGLPPLASIEHLQDLSRVTFLQELTILTFREPLSARAMEKTINTLLRADLVEQVSPVYLHQGERVGVNGMIRVRFKEAPWVNETVQREIFHRVQEEFGGSSVPQPGTGQTVLWVAQKGAPVFTIAQLLSREIAVAEAIPILVPLEPKAQAAAWVMAHGLPRQQEAVTIGDPFLVIVEVRTKGGYKAALNPNTLVSDLRKAFWDLPPFSIRVDIQDPRKEPWGYRDPEGGRPLIRCQVKDWSVPTCTFRLGKWTVQQARFLVQLFFVGRPWTVGPLAIPVTLLEGGTITVVTPPITVMVHPTLPVEVREPVGARPLPKPPVVQKPAHRQQAKKPGGELRPWQREVTTWVRERTRTWFGLERSLTERSERLSIAAGIAGIIGLGFVLAALGMIGLPLGRWLSQRLRQWGIRWAAYGRLWMVRWVPFPEFPQAFQERLLHYLAVVRGEALQPTANALASALGLPEPATWLEKRVEKEALLQILRGERRGKGPQPPRSDVVVLFILASLARYARVPFDHDEGEVLRAALIRALPSLAWGFSRRHGGVGVPATGRI